MEDFILMSTIGMFLAAILVAGMLVVVISSFIIHYMPNSMLGKWLADIWLDGEEAPDDIYNSIGNVKAGDVITKKVTK